MNDQNYKLQFFDAIRYVKAQVQNLNEKLNASDLEIRGYFVDAVKNEELTELCQLRKHVYVISEQSGFAVPPQTLRRYLFSGVQGIPYFIPDDEWKGLVNLPTEKFVDKRQQSVRSAEKIKGT